MANNSKTWTPSMDLCLKRMGPYYNLKEQSEHLGKPEIAVIRRLAKNACNRKYLLGDDDDEINAEVQFTEKAYKCLVINQMDLNDFLHDPKLGNNKLKNVSLNTKEIKHHSLPLKYPCCNRFHIYDSSEIKSPKSATSPKGAISPSQAAKSDLNTLEQELLALEKERAERLSEAAKGKAIKTLAAEELKEKIRKQIAENKAEANRLREAAELAQDAAEHAQEAERQAARRAQAAEQQAAEQKAAEQKAAEQKEAEQKAAEQQAAEQKVSDQLEAAKLAAENLITNKKRPINEIDDSLLAKRSVYSRISDLDMIIRDHLYPLMIRVEKESFEIKCLLREEVHAHGREN